MTRRAYLWLTTLTIAALSWTGAGAAPTADCGVVPGVDPYEPEFLWSTEGAGIVGGLGGRYPPVVGHLTDNDSNGVYGSSDGVDILFVSGGSQGRPSCLQVLDSSSDEIVYENCREVMTELHQIPALGDVNGDGAPEIVVPIIDRGTGDPLWIEAYNVVTAEPVWRSQPTSEPVRVGRVPMLMLADLEGDGRPEVIAGQSVLDGRSGEIRWSRAGPALRGWQAVAADLDLDGRQEVLCGGAAFSSEGRLLWEEEELSNSTIAVGNLDEDDYPEIIVSSGSRGSHPSRGGLSVLDHKGRVVWELLEDKIDGTTPTAPAVGDLDGDGWAEIVYAPEIRQSGLGYLLRTVTHDGVLLLERRIEVSSPPTQFTLYDFDADKDLEILVSEEHHVSILDGVTGAVRWTAPFTSPTAFDFPLLADLEGDGTSELVFMGAEGQQSHVHVDNWEIWVYGNASWGATRSTWNQWSYVPDHITEDMRVVQPVTAPWLTHNTFRAQLRDLNDPPEPDAGPDFRAECASPDGTPVVLDASGTTDEDGDALAFTWRGPFPEGGGEVTGERVTVTLPLGVHEITLLVDDPCVRVSDHLEITVEDTTPPEIVLLTQDPLCLWPPSHKWACWETAELLEVRDACDPAPRLEVALSSSQPEAGPGSGPFAPDVVLGEDGESLCLRSERDGRDPEGRIYAITAQSEDQAGNGSESTLRVAVPHDAARAEELCPSEPRRPTVGPENRFDPRLPGLPDPLPDPRARRR